MDGWGDGVYSDEQVARVCHDANRALQYIHGDPAPSQPWDCEPDDIKESSIAGVRNVRDGCTPRDLHDCWVEGKKYQGWVYGPAKDGERKTHPCMVEYDQLPQHQRDKDQLMFTIVTALTGDPAEGPGS